MKFTNMGFSGMAFVVATTTGPPWVYTADDNTNCEISDSNVLRITQKDADEVTYLSPSAWVSVNGPKPPDHKVIWRKVELDDTRGPPAPPNDH